MSLPCSASLQTTMSNSNSSRADEQTNRRAVEQAQTQHPIQHFFPDSVCTELCLLLCLWLHCTRQPMFHGTRSAVSKSDFNRINLRLTFAAQLLHIYLVGYSSCSLSPSLFPPHLPCTHSCGIYKKYQYYCEQLGNIC